MLDLIHAYETYLTKVKQASANTVCSYMRDIRQFTEWLQESEHTDILDATQLNISDYLSHQRVEGKSGATISRTLASLKNFYAYVISTGFLEESPVSGEIHVDRGERSCRRSSQARKWSFCWRSPLAWMPRDCGTRPCWKSCTPPASVSRS